jgi:hypothetical protein
MNFAAPTLASLIAKTAPLPVRDVAPLVALVVVVVLLITPFTGAGST